eukprot:CAMPEP_0114503998 /NCGR_PEP_ID=MMETSP0109-20121206/9960_1 /TAXON_ID=29199 /ORGANISM="Chlorarachnion reptans, Strain CCCM449" /LENGTH=90 /DNA_ID=CAMNT_0001682091 /DNA_START=668 /DNA_END=936 /DNA_ORIENTATION=-
MALQMEKRSSLDSRLKDLGIYFGNTASTLFKLSTTLDIEIGTRLGVVSDPLVPVQPIDLQFLLPFFQILRIDTLTVTSATIATAAFTAAA